MPVETATKEYGWIAYRHEVQAILDGRQSQFRRALSHQPNPEFTDFAGPEMYAPTKIDRKGEEYPGEDIFGIYCKDGEWGLPCPYGQPGDRLWVRETWAHVNCTGQAAKPGDSPQTTLYRATCTGAGLYKWKPSIHMSRWASRINLEVTGVRVERVQDITEEDIKAEGLRPDMVDSGGVTPWGAGIDIPDYHHPWIHLWDSINAKRGFGWDKNPWTWVTSFERIKP